MVARAVWLEIGTDWGNGVGYRVGEVYNQVIDRRNVRRITSVNVILSDGQIIDYRMYASRIMSGRIWNIVSGRRDNNDRPSQNIGYRMNADRIML